MQTNVTFTAWSSGFEDVYQDVSIQPPCDLYYQNEQFVTCVGQQPLPGNFL